MNTIIEFPIYGLIRCIVTSSSQDKDLFKEGDRIYFDPDFTSIKNERNGYCCSVSKLSSVKGLKYKIDRDWNRKQKEDVIDAINSLEEYLDKLNGILVNAEKQVIQRSAENDRDKYLNREN